MPTRLRPPPETAECERLKRPSRPSQHDELKRVLERCSCKSVEGTGAACQGAGYGSPYGFTFETSRNPFAIASMVSFERWSSRLLTTQ
jgi:hypothetical protein